MEAGPVPSNIYDICKAVRGDSFFSKNAQEFSKLFVIKGKYILIPQQEANLDFLSVSDMKELDNAINEYKDKSFEELKLLSHDLAWEQASLNSSINFENIMRETGADENFIDYISEFSDLKEHV
jgi:hypothetical protein